MLPSLDIGAVDTALYARASKIEGYFTEKEAVLLMRAVQSSGVSPTYLEIGSFRGRSSMFALAAMPPAGRFIGVDAFIYAIHSPPELKATLDDPRVQICEGTVIGNWEALSDHRPDVTLIDADHSFAGTALDLALVLALTSTGALIATHDMSDRFPGVTVAVEALVRAGVLAQLGSADDLVVWKVLRRPAWLLDPRPEVEEELPDHVETPSIVQLATHIQSAPGR
jgi:hypothetical protein